MNLHQTRHGPGDTTVLRVWLGSNPSSICAQALQDAARMWSTRSLMLVPCVQPHKAQAEPAQQTPR